ncbi:MAG TPA: D-alanyl-D-alanine carboxypeptidase/D-alanyl-D-alanine-endopeptidase [Chroococcales cyanobacterium]
MKKVFVFLSFFLFFFPATAGAFDPKSLDAILSQPLSEQSHIGVEIRSLSSGKTLYSRDAQKLFTPASVQKIVTSLAALHFLGADTRFDTEISTDGKIENSCLLGNLFLRGGGDPSLKKGDFGDLCAGLEKKGISRVEGDLIADASFFDDAPYPPGWMRDDIECDYATPVSALSVDENFDGSPVLNPPLRAGKIFAARLEAAGIHLAGTVRVGKTPPGTTSLFIHRSPSLAELIKEMNKHSNNFYAETLLEQLGAGEKGNREKGIIKVSSMLAQIGWAKDGYRIADGSGLSRYNALTPSQLASLLVYANSDPFQNSLPVAGVDGTLAHRLIGSPAAGRLFAKTGTMAGVSCLAGYLDTGKERLAIAIMVNGFVGSAHALQALQDSIILALIEPPPRPPQGRGGEIDKHT